MVRKIEDKEIMTTRETREKYKEYYIGFVTTERNMEDPDNTRGRVVFMAGSKNEIYEAPEFKEKRKKISVITGYAVGGTEIGGVYFD